MLHSPSPKKKKKIFVKNIFLRISAMSKFNITFVEPAIQLE